MDMNLDFVDQQQEHWDYEAGVASELQNAYQNSRNNIDLNGDDAAILTARRVGYFVAVLESPVYCPATDAILGNKRVMLGYGSALEEVTALLSSYEEDQECNVYVAHPEVA